jgi:hypothetical protein
MRKFKGTSSTYYTKIFLPIVLKHKMEGCHFLGTEVAVLAVKKPDTPRAGRARQNSSERWRRSGLDRASKKKPWQRVTPKWCVGAIAKDLSLLQALGVGGS